MNKKTTVSKIKNNNALTETKNELVEIEDLKKNFNNQVIDGNKLLIEFNKLNKLQKRSKDEEEKRYKVAKELTILFGLENGTLLQTTVNSPDYSMCLLKIRQDLIKEYGCTKPSELMLMDRIVSAYWRGMRFESYLNRLIEKEPNKFSFDAPLLVSIVKELHKGIELANRQFETGLTLLRNLNQPRLNIRVNADNAYLAQNQQINNKKESLKPNDLGSFYEVAS